MKTIDVKGRPYVEVNERLKYFRENYKNWSLESDIISLENGVCVIKATIKDDNGVIKATGLAYEKENSTFINKTSYIENCETSAWGRALGNLGIGIDTSVASADEVQNAMLNQNPDQEMLDGLKKCSNLDELKAYFEKYVKEVKDQKTFINLKNKRKRELTNEIQRND